MNAGKPRTLAGRSIAAWITLAIATSLLLTADLVSKQLAFERIAERPVVVDRQVVLTMSSPREIIPPHEPVVVVPNVLELTLVLNQGAVFGIGAGARWFFVGFTGLAMLFVLGIFATSTLAHQRLAHLGAAMLMSGGLGNMHDRLRYACVRDFLHPLPDVTIGGWTVWPYVSNVADLWVLIGIVILLLHAWRPVPKSARAPAASDEGDSRGDG